MPSPACSARRGGELVEGLAQPFLHMKDCSINSFDYSALSNTSPWPSERFSLHLRHTGKNRYLARIIYQFTRLGDSIYGYDHLFLRAGNMLP